MPGKDRLGVFMNNIFDHIAELYQQDEGWQMVIPYRAIERYFRTQVWQGKTDEDMMQQWDYITMYFVYLGNGETMAGDMNCYDFMDCVAWCGRNIADFALNKEQVTDFLNTLIDLYKSLRQQKLVIGGTGAQEALDRLIIDGRLCHLQADGSFDKTYGFLNERGNGDLERKVFLRFTDNIERLHKEIQAFFNKKYFTADIERATFFYTGIFSESVIGDDPNSEEYPQSFWDYFIYDYHLIATDQRPIDYFIDYFKEHRRKFDNKLSYDVLKELAQAELKLFTIDGEIDGDGLYPCTDLLTEQRIRLMLPIDGTIPQGPVVFIGHIFYNGTMVLNFIRGMALPVFSQKKLRAFLSHAKTWYEVRREQEPTWENFVARNPLVVRHALLTFGSCIRLDNLVLSQTMADYVPAEPDSDRDTRVLAILVSCLQTYNFSIHDIACCQQLWLDFYQAYGKQVRAEESWAAGAAKVFIELNGVYNYSLSEITDLFYGVSSSSVQRTSAEIKEVLQIEKHDPRYLSEEGMLVMLFR